VIIVKEKPVKLIAHRGNYKGANPHLENVPHYLEEALDKGYDIEVDVWGMGENLWLGHDKPKCQINYAEGMKLVPNPNVWWHVKNYEALIYLITRWPHLKVFSHESDNYAIVTGGYVWTAHTMFPVPSKKTIVMISEPSSLVLKRVFTEDKVLGICCDDFRELEK